MSAGSQLPGRLLATWQRYRQQSNRVQFVIAIVVLGAMVWLCDAVTPSGEPPTPTPAIAPLMAPVDTQQPTDAPTDTAEPPTEQPTEPPTMPPPTDTQPPAEPTQPPPPTESLPPTEAPVSGPVPDYPNQPPTDQPWLPCARGQIKANTESMIYHTPGGSFYTRTYRHVYCFNSAGEAEAAGYRRAER